MRKIIIALSILLIFTTGCNNKLNIQNNDNVPGTDETNENANDINTPNEENPNNNDPEGTPSTDETTTLFHEFENDASRLLVDLTLEEKIGQIFLVRCPLDEDLTSFMSMRPGGFIMFGRDFKDKTKDEVVNNIKSYQANSKIPMIIGVDEEGGTVVRVSTNPLLSNERFKSPQELYKIGGFDEIKNDTTKKSKLLLDLGINLNLAPVADISVDKNDFIYDRAFGKSASETSEYVKTVISTMGKSKISAALKHFPGYGNNVDTHTGSSYDNRPYEHFEKSDFLPFIAGIEAGAESVLVSHNIVEAMDKTLPASLSKNVHDILRNELNFTGIIMTDDMSMAAIQNLKDISPEVVAIEAGNDMLIVTDFKESYNVLLNAVKNNEISIEKIDEAVLRILKWKYYMGIM